MRATLQGTIGKHKELQSVPWVAPGTAGACMNLKVGLLARESVSSCPSAAGVESIPSKLTERVLLQGRMPECIDALSRFFSENWPMSFRRLFEDASGCVVVVFDYHQAEQEGDMTSFMNHTAKTHAAAVEFQLAKDSTRWGVMEGTEPHVYFVFWPPWTRHRARVPDHLTGPAPRPTKLMWESSPPLPVHRVPHVLGNANCLFDQGYQKRVSEQTFR